MMEIRGSTGLLTPNTPNTPDTPDTPDTLDTLLERYMHSLFVETLQTYYRFIGQDTNNSRYKLAWVIVGTFIDIKVPNPEERSGATLTT